MNIDSSQRIFHIILMITGTAACTFFSIPSALILAAVSLSFFISSEVYRRKRRNITLKLCDDIDSILRGNESVRFEDYRNDDLSVLTAEIHKMTLRLREQNSALLSEKQFMKESLEDISHQLRTPLTSAVLLLEMLRAPDLSPQNKSEYMQELYSLMTRMEWLIETLLGLSRIEAGAVQFRSQKIVCSELIAAAIEPISIALEIKDIAIEVKGDTKCCFMGDIQYFTEALLNLLKNCMEHTPEGGKIVIDAVDTPIYTGLTVTDSGNGFDEEELPHIFERFYRSHNSSQSGYGIGLAFARRIITAQNGSLQAVNSTDGGACFDMRIYKQTV